MGSAYTDLEGHKTFSLLVSVQKKKKKAYVAIILIIGSQFEGGSLTSLKSEKPLSYFCKQRDACSIFLPGPQPRSGTSLI